MFNRLPREINTLILKNLKNDDMIALLAVFPNMKASWEQLYKKEPYQHSAIEFILLQHLGEKPTSSIIERATKIYEWFRRDNNNKKNNAWCSVSYYQENDWKIINEKSHGDKFTLYGINEINENIAKSLYHYSFFN